MKSVALLTFYLMAIVAVVISFNYRDCGSSAGELLDVNVSSCNGQTRCSLKRGDNVEIAITYKVKYQTSKIKPDVKGKLRLLPAIPFNPPVRNACSSTVPTCPLNAGATSVYRSQIPIRQWYPTVDVDVTWELKDDQGRSIACVQVPAKVV